MIFYIWIQKVARHNLIILICKLHKISMKKHSITIKSHYNSINRNYLFHIVSVINIL